MLFFYSRTKLNQEEIDNLNILITKSKIESVIKKNSLPTEVQYQMVSQANSSKYTKQNLH